MKTVICTCLIALCFCGCRPPKAAPADTTVYITNTGECYHRGNCKSIKKSKIPLSLEKAVRQYRPCKLCNPPREVSGD